MKNILIVVGTRPNFIKVTQFKKIAARDFPGAFNIKIVHTGQHYDDKMADVFFSQFDLVPDYFLEIPPSSPNSQMAEVMLRLERVLNEFKADLLVVTGDVNSTFAASLTANKMNIPLAHVESGLRSCDRSMPEEINRILTDEISDYLFITERSGIDNLKNEGKNEDQLFFVGNTMIDTMVAFEDKINASPILDELGLETGAFALMTMHRPATVDHKDELLKLIQLIEDITEMETLVFPIHPRTVKKLKQFELYERIESNKKVLLTEPMGYFSFQKLIAECEFILTDSGGIQEESTFRKVPCLTLRPNTERPSTIQIGSNTLVPFDLDEIKKLICSIKDGRYKKGAVPPKWDGKATNRILDSLSQML
ncbi:UDP-N-acetylglucosamine 2-epimerase (non-hydrolyzing) [Aliifodinibius sp. S!AR15-10]|uniref:non-hydrolyzing UDP-N-acetylglucosamine 2-epimerase n=1 Tax=Aliifodinibius sp. S!AR15-10 TaxID=2950437 RepID=UPI002854DB24|nr:UDP-N-acetylglucosamine 2-epimerase (non-hydrolyzing) [Aliifodinibius sp. S!AR15-10]MDR8390228.1 UDP-N-acetylglucosamine 2-epimerase (non-hydrolyzing) [Aliifodinibius sp. S!AR15-10]